MIEVDEKESQREMKKRQKNRKEGSTEWETQGYIDRHWLNGNQHTKYSREDMTHSRVREGRVGENQCRCHNPFYAEREEKMNEISSFFPRFDILLSPIWHPSWLGRKWNSLHCFSHPLISTRVSTSKSKQGLTEDGWGGGGERGRPQEESHLHPHSRGGCPDHPAPFLLLVSPFIIITIIIISFVKEPKKWEVVVMEN